MSIRTGLNSEEVHVQATNHAYLQLRAEPNCEGRTVAQPDRVEGSLRTLWQPPYDSCLITVHSYCGRVS